MAETDANVILNKLRHLINNIIFVERDIQIAAIGRANKDWMVILRTVDGA